jgi:hypothetical protein
MIINCIGIQSDIFDNIIFSYLHDQSIEKNMYGIYSNFLFVVLSNTYGNNELPE